MWDDTDGCSKQYYCGKAMYFLLLLATSFDIIIDCVINAPGHGKNAVDGLNAVTKWLLLKEMCMVGNPESEDYH